MNNQVKLIDANKLLKWIEEDKGAEGFWGEGEMVHQATCSFDNLTDAINEGKFDPDTPPVPTIKPGDKVRHPYYDEGIVKVYDLNGDGRALVAFEDPDCGERLILHRDLEVVE